MRAPPSKAAAAGCLQSIFTALHPELERFVRRQVSQTVSSGLSNSNEVDAILGVSKNGNKLDFGSCLKFMHTHWFSYFQSFPYELRQVAQDLTQLRHSVAHQIQLSGDELNDAITDLSDLQSRFTPADARETIFACVSMCWKIRRELWYLQTTAKQSGSSGIALRFTCIHGFHDFYFQSSNCWFTTRLGGNVPVQSR